MKTIELLLDPIEKDQPTQLAHLYTNDFCSHCHTSSHNLEIHGYYVNEPHSINAYILEHCSNCNRISLREFLHVSPPIFSEPPFPGAKVFLDLTQKKSTRYFYNFNLSDFNSYIEDLSPRFVEIYNQAEKAEQFGLYEICGMGYRKALEILVKDFLSNHKNERDAAKGSLFDVLNKIDDLKIKEIADVCRKLGNDATHYSVYYGEETIALLKEFLDEVVSYIIKELRYEKAKTLMNSSSN